MDAAVTSRLATGSYVAPDNTSITGIKAKTDNLPASPASVSDVPTAATNAAAVRTNLATELARMDTAVSTRNAVAPDNTNIAAIASKLPSAGANMAGEGTTAKNLDQVSGGGGGGGTAPTAAENAAAVRTNLATELGRIDVAVSTRLAALPDIPQLASVIGDSTIVSDDPTATFTLDDLST